MQGLLRLNAIGQWYIVGQSGERVTVSAGDVIEVYSFARGDWVRAVLLNGPQGLHARGVAIYQGQLARSTQVRIVQK